MAAPAPARPVTTLHRIGVIVQSVKAMDISNYDDLATGYKVDPEGHVSKDVKFNPRGIMADCQTWQACASLVDESPERFERNKTLAFHLLMRLADLLGSPAASPSTALTRHVALPAKRPPKNPDNAQPEGDLASVNSDGGFSDPFADLLQKDAHAASRQVVGREREAAMKLAKRVLNMTVINIDRMRGDNVCRLLYTLCRLELSEPKAMKAIVVYMKTNAKKFLVNELYASLAACAALNYKVPSAALQAILDQAQKGLRHALPADLNNIAYALHVQPRGAMTHKHVNALIRVARNAVFDMSATGLSYLVTLVARQGYRPSPGFVGAVMEALGPHLPTLQDPHALVALLYGLSTLKVELHDGLTAAVERIMVAGQGLAALSPEQLGVLGTVLSAYSKQYVPSEQLRSTYVAQVLQRLPEADETSAAGLLSGLAYMSKLAADGAKPAAPAAAPASSMSPALSARLAKLAAKKSSSQPGFIPAAALQDLLELLEPRLQTMSGLTLLQQAQAVHTLGHAPDQHFADAFKQAVLSAAPRCSTYTALIALLKAAQPECAALRIEGEVQEFAAAVAAQAVVLSQGPPKPAAPAVSEAGEGAEEMYEDFIDYSQFLPTQAELTQLRELLAGLPSVDAAVLELPEAKPDEAPGMFRGGPRGGRGGRGGRGSSRWDDGNTQFNSWTQDAVGGGNSWYDDAAPGGGSGYGFDDTWSTSGQLAYGDRRDNRRSSRQRSSWADEGFDLDAPQDGWQDTRAQRSGGRGATLPDGWSDSGWQNGEEDRRSRRKQPARAPPKQFEDSWFDGGLDGGGEQGGGDLGWGEQADANDYVARGFDRSVDLDDGMADMWDQPAAPARARGTRASKAPQAAENGFSGLLDDFEFGFESPAAGVVGEEPVGGLGSGPRSKVSLPDGWGVQVEDASGASEPAATPEPSDVIKSTRGRRRRSTTPAE